MKLGDVYVEVKGDTAKVKGDLAELKRSSDTASAGMTASWAKVGVAMVAVAAAVAVTGKAIKKLEELVDVASALEEAFGKFSVVFSDQMVEAEQWSKTLVDSFAMSTRESYQFLSSIQDLLVPMGMASDEAGKMSFEVVKLSADLGSFNDLPTAQVMGDIQSALVGNYETMKKYGVVLNATVVQEKALAMGLADTKAELTAADKAQAAYTLIVAGSEKAVGDMARTSENYANQVKRMEARVEDLAAKIGKTLLPIATEIVTAVADWIEKNDDLIAQPIEKWIKDMTSGLEELYDIYKKVADLFFDPSRLQEAEKTALESRKEWVKVLEEGKAKIAEIKELEAEIEKGEKSKWSWAGARLGINKTNLKVMQDELKELGGQEKTTRKRYLEDEKIVTKLKEQTAELDRQKAAIEATTAPAKKLDEALNFKGKADDAVLLASSMDIVMESEKSIIRAGEDSYKAHKKRMEDQAKEAETSAADRLHAYESMYKDLKGYADKNYDVQVQLIENQKQKYIDATDDTVAASAWAAQQYERLERDKALASDDFFAGMKVGWKDMVDEQTTWAEHGKGLFDDVRDAWKTSVGDMVDAFIAGETDKRTVAEVTADILTDISGRMAKRMFDAAIDAIIDLISIQIGSGASGSGAAGATKGGAWGAIAEIGIFLGTGVAAMLAGRAMGEQFRASGGWIENHPYGGLIQQGSGTRDDVLLGYTSNARHWGMGGEYVINKESTAKHRELIELINRDKGMVTGGYLDRGYQAGAAVPWEPVADMLAIGTIGSGLHGLYKGGPYGAIAEMIIFFASAVTSMFTGKFLANEFKSDGGMIDVGHLDLGPITDVVDAITGAVGSIPIIGDTLSNILNWFDPEFLIEKIIELIRVPLEAVSRDLVTPGKYYSNPIDTIVNLLENIDLSVPHLRQGGRIPRTGLFYGHEGERVLNEEETVRYEKGGSETVNNNFYINAVDAKSFADLCARNPQAIIGPLADSAMRGREFRTLVKGIR